MARDVDITGLQAAIAEAGCLTTIFAEWMSCHCGFEHLRLPRALSEKECSHVYYGVTTIVGLIEEAQRILDGKDTQQAGGAGV